MRVSDWQDVVGEELEDGGGGDGDELADPKARWEERPGSEMLIEDWLQHISGGEVHPAVRVAGGKLLRRRYV